MIINPFRFFKDLLLNLYPAEVGFSLRKINDNYTGDCITVRRSLDNASLGIGFNDTDLDTVALEAFCNPNAVIYTSDFTAGNEDLNEINGIGTDGETVGGVSDCYKFEVSGGLGVHQAIGNLPEDGQRYTISFDYYIPSTNTKSDSIAILPKLGGGQAFVDGVDQWKSATIDLEVSVGALPRFRFRPAEGTETNIDADGDVFYLKNIVITQLTSDGYVTTWYDQSGNGNDATQTTAASQPKIVSSGSVILENGKPFLDFDGTDDSLELSSNIPSVKTIVDVTASNGVYLGGDSNYFAHLGNFRLRIPPINYDFAVKTNNQKVSFFSYDGSTATQSYDGGTESNNSLTNVLSATSIGRFGIVYTGTQIQELIVYTDDKNDEQSGIEENINDYYNIY